MPSSRHVFTDLPFATEVKIRDKALKELERRIMEAPVDIREPLSDYSPIADEFQQRVIEATERTIRVLAPAGSGKTQTIVHRVLCAIRAGLNPKRILVLSFDNAAATSLNGKLQKQLEEIGMQLEGLTISTLNAFGYAVLREYFPNEYRPVIEDLRRVRLIREILERLKEKSKERYDAVPKNLAKRYYLDLFSLLKNELFDPRNLPAQRLADFVLSAPQATPLFRNPKDSHLIKLVVEAVIWMYMTYEKLLQREKLMDFDDQKLRPYKLLEGNTVLLSMLQNQYSEIIVDEFQDINKLDFAFIKALAVGSALIVVGDDDQAIYGFRGCTPDFIIHLSKHLDQQVTTYELQYNYRCPPNILEHADRLIRNNKNRVIKNPIPKSTTPSEIKIVSTLSAGLEAKLVAHFIKQVRRVSHKLRFRDLVVLYRTNAQSLPLQVEFILNNIPYYVREEDNILTNEILERLLGVLRLKTAILGGAFPHPHDCSLTIRAYFRFTGGGQLAAIENLFYRDNDFLSGIISQDFYAILPKARESLLPAAIHEVLGARSLLDTLDVVASKFHGLQGMIGSLEDVMDEKVPLGEIYEIAANFRGDISEFVNAMETALVLARKTQAGKDEENGVGLLTYFKAKGRQWHTVILTTCNEGIIPHRKAPMEDERRLFYVALTRAESNLLISYVNNVCKNAVAPSRFLKEAGLL